jgi:DNA-binding PadR family transcriptional regulator
VAGKSARSAVSVHPATIQSPVRWALLSLVIAQPSYGYELAARFERRYGDLLRLHSHGQAYEGLTSLERHGFIEAFYPRPAGQRQPKPHYRVTNCGLAAYQEMLAHYPDEEYLRLSLSARELAVLARRRPEAALEILDAWEAAWLDDSARRTDPAGGGTASDPLADLASALQDRASRLSREAKLSWLEYARRAVQAVALNMAESP